MRVIFFAPSAKDWKMEDGRWKIEGKKIEDWKVSGFVRLVVCKISGFVRKVVCKIRGWKIGDEIFEISFENVIDLGLSIM